MAYQPNVHKQFAAYFDDKNLEPYLYLLSKRLDEGQICLDLNEDFQQELKDEYSQIQSKDILQANQLIAKDKVTYQPFVLLNNKLYLQRYFNYENSVFEKISSLISQEKDKRQFYENQLLGLNGFIKNPFQRENPTKVDWQLVAAISAVLHQFTIITGGPGTGKTTTVALILTLLFKINSDMKVALAAPTGKAATRMSESLRNQLEKSSFQIDENIREKFEKIEPHTLHRLLGTQKDSIYFKHNEKNFLPYDLIIVDESSMLDVALFSKLIRAVSDDSKIILLGDRNQLSSVETGSLFGDLCTVNRPLNLFSQNRAGFINRLIPKGQIFLQEENISTADNLLFEHIIELKDSFRFTSDGGIGKLSMAIIENDIQKVEEFYKSSDDQVVLVEAFSTEKLKEIALAYREYIKEENIFKALQKFKKLRILCAIREGAEGVHEWNKKVQDILKDNGLLKIDSEYYEHRPVIVNKNNYELGLFNGDIGLIRFENGVKRAWFESDDDGIKSVSASSLDSVDTVFAMTIHKSQGSEFDKVLVVLPQKKELPILTRELLYTAVTRAKEKVTVIGKNEVVKVCCEKRVKRGSGIADRFLNSI
ncbi:MAG: exodeoxyribonuclease V subunit alpha [Chitinophagales bacterium]|nr:exodeoxyribonuclease V subunit alpha [Chitinophagales bacterium]